MSVEAAFDRALRAAREHNDFNGLVVAVSGGGDSMALLSLAAGWGREARLPVLALTVDHGLRPASADEARQVAGICAGLGVDHRTLRWTGWDGAGNLQAKARDARYRLVAQEAAAALDRPAVLVGHTKDDLAETFLMRLARGSGVDGLAAMRGEWREAGILWLRPLIEVTRGDLRDYLRGQGADWIEDPSNDDEGFTRVRMRRAMALLDEVGLDTDRLAGTARTMARVRSALDHYTLAAGRDIARTEAGDVLFDAAALSAVPDEIRLRLLAGALVWVTSAAYRPRFEALCDLDDKIASRGRMTLGGALFTLKRGELRVTREPKAVEGLRAVPGALWDNRWRVSPPPGFEAKSLSVERLGEAGLRDCPNWRETGLPRDSLLSGPAVWDRAMGDARLVAAPRAGLENGWSASLHPYGGDFLSSLLSH
ncbi:tRNA lysidine(34) synthetase TilS [Maritimibacter sp. DP1N21-5]|uniref:tRNA lysidine(34) synthetase TilS n=1 Tax=Maritimibacter sp. DP1N21-5 TaxID=2836867 RepID=UPI001C45822D|nr:tRNA lysidine(34) synthetase TilS [Maritimibacter sp. DP1N21-5]MBV7410230.1 tRNA lysidine(34) synthetase TilS [Maritimibacter sp. DP1N21-5]